MMEDINQVIHNTSLQTGCGEGQMQVRTCPLQRKAQLIPFSEQATPWRIGGASGEIVIELSIVNTAKPPYTKKLAWDGGHIRGTHVVE